VLSRLRCMAPPREPTLAPLTRARRFSIFD
jgi:hypothetical protein